MELIKRILVTTLTTYITCLVVRKMEKWESRRGVVITKDLKTRPLKEVLPKEGEG